MTNKTKQVRDALAVLLRNSCDYASFSEAVAEIFSESEESAHHNAEILLGNFQRVAHHIVVAADPEIYHPDHPADPDDEARDEAVLAARGLSTAVAPGKVKQAHDRLFAGKPAGTVYDADAMRAARHNEQVELARGKA